MSSLTGSFDPSALFTARGVDLATLGAAYLTLLATTALTIAAFVAARKLLVVSPNRGSRDYGIYVSLTLATLLVAIVLENESLPAGSATLHYVIVPQLAILLGLHLWIWQRQEPWLVTLGAAAATATIVVGLLLGVGTELLGPSYWITLSLLAALLAFLWRKAISTQRGFVKASSIYIGSKEAPGAADGTAETLARLAAMGRALRGQPRARHRELAAARPRTGRNPRRRSRRRVRSIAPGDGARLRRARHQLLGDAQSVDAGPHAVRLARLDRRRLRADLRQLPQ